MTWSQNITKAPGWQSPKKILIHCANEGAQPKTFWTFWFSLLFPSTTKKISHQSPPPTNLHPTPNAHTKRPVSSRSSRIAAYPGNIVAYRYGRQRLGEAHLSKKEHGTCRNVCSRKIALGKRILTFWALQRMNFSSARQNQFKVPCYNQRFQAAMWLLLSAS